MILYKNTYAAAALGLVALLFANCASPIIKAARTGGPAELQKAIDEGADVNGRSLSGTPLYAAAERQNVAAARFLLEKGAKPDFEDHSSLAPPLFVAAALGNLELVNLLLEKGASPSFEKQVNSPHYWQILGLGQLAKGRALHGAAQGHRIAHGDSAFFGGGPTRAPTVTAPEMEKKALGYLRVIERLAFLKEAHTQDVQTATMAISMVWKTGQSPEVVTARRKLQIALLDRLRPENWTFELWGYLTAEQNLTILEYALARATPPAGPRTGQTLWHMHSARSCWEEPDAATARKLFRLLARRIPVNTPDREGRSPLHTSAMSHWGIASTCTPMLVREFKANINAVDRYGWTVAHYYAANWQQDSSTIRRTLESYVSVGANLNAKIGSVPPEFQGRAFFLNGQQRFIQPGMTVREMALLRGVHLP